MATSISLSVSWSNSQSTLDVSERELVSHSEHEQELELLDSESEPESESESESELDNCKSDSSGSGNVLLGSTFSNSTLSESLATSLPSKVLSDMSQDTSAISLFLSNIVLAGSDSTFSDRHTSVGS